MTISLKSLINESIAPSSMDTVLKKGYGWISPRGEYYAVDMYSHFSIIQKLPVSEKLKREIDNHIDDLIRIEKDCQEIGGEWHCYEMTEDNARDAIFKAMYDEGWIRFGVSFGRKIWEFEGSPIALKDRMPVIRKFKKLLDPDVDIKITPRKL